MGRSNHTIDELAPDRPAWERQPGEGERPYEHFRAWLESGMPRMPLADLAQARGVSLATVQGYSSRCRWTERAQAYDRATTTEVRAEIVRAYASEADSIVQRQASTAARLNELAQRELDKLLEQSRSQAMPTLTARTLLQVIQMALAMDKLITNEDVTARLPLPDLGVLSDSDLLTLRALAAKTTGSSD